MNTRSAMARRDWVAACVLTLAVAAFLFTWSPSLRPGFSPPRPMPPAITYCPAALMAGELQEHYDEWNAAHSPSLIALSTAMMLPPAICGQAEAITPPLEAAYSLLRFPDTPPMERPDQITVLTPPRPMTHLAPQRLAALGSASAYARGTRPQAPATPSFRVNLTGNWEGRSVDLSPISALSEPAGPWSFTAVLRYDKTGRVQHALLESASLNQPLRDEVARRLYQCRVTPSGTSGEGRLTVSGPGHP